MESIRIARVKGNRHSAEYRAVTFTVLRENGKVVWRPIAESIISGKPWELLRLFPQAKFNVKLCVQDFLYDGKELTDVETVDYLQTVQEEITDRTGVDYRPSEVIPEDYYAY